MKFKSCEMVIRWLHNKRSLSGSNQNLKSADIHMEPPRQSITKSYIIIQCAMNIINLGIYRCMQANRD